MGQGAPAAGFDACAVARARAQLEAKRRRAAAHLLPRLRHALGTAWARRFGPHAAAYAPDGLLYHVDDAWAFAERMRREARGEPAARRAAHDDLVSLRSRYARTTSPGPARIRARRGLFVAVTFGPPRAIVVRWPGVATRVWSLRLSWRPSGPAPTSSGARTAPRRDSVP